MTVPERAPEAGLHARLADRYGSAGRAVYGFFGCLAAVALSGLAAHVLRQPLLFPSLGPSAVLFFEKPTAPESTPFNALVGHIVGIAAGVATLALFGLLHAPSVLEAGVTTPRVGAAALSVALVALVLPLLKANHPPAGATTLLVSLGLLNEPRQLATIIAGVVLLTAVAWVINRLAGVNVPFRAEG
jgi:CBS domain-containing membrane protein